MPIGDWIREATEKRRQRILDQGREEGLKKGREEGRKEGREEGRVQGYEIGYADGSQGQPMRDISESSEQSSC